MLLGNIIIILKSIMIVLSPRVEGGYAPGDEWLGRVKGHQTRQEVKALIEQNALVNRLHITSHSLVRIQRGSCVFCIS